MPSTEVTTDQVNWEKGFETNATDTSFSNPTVTTTEPSITGAGVWVGEVEGSNSLMILPFGTDANNETFDMRIWTWRRGVDTYDTTLTEVWIPLLLCTCSVTLGNLTGVAASALLDTEYLADTISSVSPSPFRSQHVASPGDTTADISHGVYIGDMFGALKAEVRIDLTGAASANFFYAWI